MSAASPPQDSPLTPARLAAIFAAAYDDGDHALDLLATVPLPSGILAELAPFNSYEIVETLIGRFPDLDPDDPGYLDLVTSEPYLFLWARGEAPLAPPLPPPDWPSQARYLFALNSRFDREDRLEVFRCSTQPFVQQPTAEDVLQATAAFAHLRPSRPELASLASTADLNLLQVLISSPEPAPGVIVRLWENFADQVDFARSAFYPSDPPSDTLATLSGLHRNFCLNWTQFNLPLLDYVAAPVFPGVPPTSGHSITITGSNASQASSVSSMATHLADSLDSRVFASIDPAAYRAAARAVRSVPIDTDLLDSPDLLEAVCELRTAFTDPELAVLLSALATGPLRFAWFWELYVLPKLSDSQVRLTVRTAAAAELYLAGPLARSHFRFDEAVSFFPLRVLLAWPSDQLHSWLADHEVDAEAFFTLSGKLADTPALDVLNLLRT